MRPDEDGGQQLRLLEAAWDRAREHWHDDMTRQFDTQHWTPLVQETRRYLEALRGLLDALDAAEYLDLPGGLRVG
jgi:hypothetical protein